MHKATIVTFLVSSVLTLAGGSAFSASMPKHLQHVRLTTQQSTKPNSVRSAVVAALGPKIIMSADQAIRAEETTVTKKFAGVVAISRSTSLNDFQDGSRSDSVDYLFIPSYKIKYGTLSSKLMYSQNLRDESPEASKIADASVTFAKSPLKWEWSSPYILVLTPTLTAIVPLSQASQKRDQLQTAVIAGISFGIVPDGLSLPSGFSLAVGITAGRNFHQFEESLDGKLILNRYSSNQSVNLGYAYEQFSIGVEYIHKSRFSYQNSTKDSFELSQEIGYAINENFSVAIGHSNAALSGMKANGSEPSFKFINENDSTVYAQLGISF